MGAFFEYPHLLYFARRFKMISEMQSTSLDFGCLEGSAWRLELWWNGDNIFKVQLFLIFDCVFNSLELIRYIFWSIHHHNSSYLNGKSFLISMIQGRAFLSNSGTKRILHQNKEDEKIWYSKASDWNNEKIQISVCFL